MYNTLDEMPLGKITEYIDGYEPNLLFPIPRHINRHRIHLPTPLPFHGQDVWNAFEFSWLNNKGKPQIALLEILLDCQSPNLIESKSLKLYLNSFNQSTFDNWEQVQETLTRDLTKACGHYVDIHMIAPEDFAQQRIAKAEGLCLDDLDISIEHYNLHPDYLICGKETAQETLYSHLLRSTCLITKQPDWATITIKYEGPRIHHEGLLKYIVSFRQENDFSEQCIERIYQDILIRCKPKKLTVFARYTRRGGLDINPFRSNVQAEGVPNIRDARQ